MSSTDVVSVDASAALVEERAHAAAAPVSSEWVETALTVVFATAAVLFVSFLAVVTGLV
jgi:hypothetical protein